MTPSSLATCVTEARSKGSVGVMFWEWSTTVVSCSEVAFANNQNPKQLIATVLGGSTGGDAGSANPITNSTSDSGPTSGAATTSEATDAAEGDSTATAVSSPTATVPAESDNISATSGDTETTSTATRTGGASWHDYFNDHARWGRRQSHSFSRSRAVQFVKIRRGWVGS